MSDKRKAQGLSDKTRADESGKRPPQCRKHAYSSMPLSYKYINYKLKFIIGYIQVRFIWMDARNGQIFQLYIFNTFY